MTRHVFFSCCKFSGQVATIAYCYGSPLIPKLFPDAPSWRLRRGRMLATHDPALFWRHVDARVGGIGGDTRRLRRFASVTFDALQGSSCSSARLVAGQECDAPFPGLRSQPWWDAREFEWAETVEAGAAVIGSELSRFEASAASAEDGAPL